MKNTNLNIAASSRALWETAADDLPSRYNLHWMVRSVLGHPLLLAVTTAIAVLIALVIVISGIPSYSAVTTVQVTNLRLSMSGREDAYFAESQYDPSFVDTQVQIINSKTVAEAVIDSLGLSPPPVEPGMMDVLKGHVSEMLKSVSSKSEPIVGDDARRAALLRGFSDSMKVQRIGQSDLVEIRYTDKSAANAALIANEIAQKYIAKIDADRIDSAQAGSSWLRTRLQEIGPKARVVSPAAVPTKKDGLSGLIVILLGALVGFAIAVFIALARELLNTTIRSPEQIRDSCGVECIGMVPLLRGPARGRKDRVLHDYFSPLWQALRQVAVIADGTGVGSRMRTIGFTSTLPGEGKTLMATNFSAMSASSGKKVLLVDAQPYNPSISNDMSPAGSRGLTEFISSDDEPLSAFVYRDPRSNYDILPLGERSERSQVSHLLWSDGMRRFISGAEHYDIIVFDLPPMIASGDLRAAANHLDGLFQVTQWGRVRETEFRSALALVPCIRDALRGVIINKVRSRKMRSVFSPDAYLLKKQQLLAKRT